MNLKEIRKKYNVTQIRASEILGINIKTYRKYEECDDLEESKKYALLLLNHFKENLKPINTTSDDFASIITSHSFYVDKTLLIKDLITNSDTLTLFTRPRRFGKSLNMSMLKSFFDIHASKDLFDGLNISKEREICDKYQNQLSVISLTFKDVSSDNYESFLYYLAFAISKAVDPILLTSEKLNAQEKEMVEKIYNYQINENEICKSIYLLCNYLNKHYGKKVVLLIDEYDVPLQYASSHGYYEKAIIIMRNLLSESLKSNTHVFLGVLTGSLKISKESIFTSLNNLKCYSILDKAYHSYFGFSSDEVDHLLHNYYLINKKEEVKINYDGFVIGGEEMYCPFDVMNYIKDHKDDNDAPINYYWVNSSENEIVRRLLLLADEQIRNEIETLIEGGNIIKRVDLSLTYRDIFTNADNIYSILTISGYLASKERLGNDLYKLSIPNKGILKIFIDQISHWINTDFINKEKDDKLITYFFNKDVDRINQYINNLLWKTISVHDYSRRRDDKEGFYHGLLLGLLKSANDDERNQIISNPESGLGYVDIIAVDYLSKKCFIVEIKAINSDDFESAYNTAIEQIDSRQYTSSIPRDFEIITYIAMFYKKSALFKIKDK